MRRRPPLEGSLGAEERSALARLAPHRVTVERLVRRSHAAFAPRGDLNNRAIEADVEALWSVVLAAYALGVGAVHEALHRAEGIDHPMIDEAIDYAMQAVQADRKGGR